MGEEYDYRMAEVQEYLLSRLRDKDATIERLMKELTGVKRLLLRTYDWLEFWERRLPADDRFESEQLRAELMAAYRVPNIDDS